MFYNRVHSSTILTQNNRPANEHIECEEENPPYLPDFIKLAEAHGACAKRVTKPEDVAGALKEAFDSPKTWILEFIVEPESNVMPMIPPAGTVADTIRTFK
jgi:acetolactate synthase-1/2/3 large subunit